MKLIINNYNASVDLKPFITSVLLPTAVEMFFAYVDRKRYQPYAKFLQTTYNLDTPVNIDNILITGIKNLSVKGNKNSYEISINSNIISPGVPAKLIDVCALVNYGNLSLNPYPIFDIVMEKLGEQVPSLYDEYKTAGGE